MSDLSQLRRLRIEADGDTRGSQLAEIRREIRTAPRRRSRVGRYLAAAAILAVPSVAVASTGSAPGEALYPVKLAVEPLVWIFDRDVMADHRIDEVEALIRRGADDAVIRRHIDVARSEIDRVESSIQRDRLSDRLNLLVRDRDRTPAETSDRPQDLPDVTTVPSDGDRPTDTTRPADDQPASQTGTEPTTTPGDRPTDTTPPADDPPATDASAATGGRSGDRAGDG